VRNAPWGHNAPRGQAAEVVEQKFSMVSPEFLIEGFLTPAAAPHSLKLAFAALTVPLLVFYLAGGLRRGSEERSVGT